MAQPFVTLPAGIMAAGGPAAAVVTTNSRVKTQLGALGLVTDVLQFGGPMVTGMWITGNSRVSVNHVPTVSTNATGTATNPATPASAPVTVASGDPRASGS
jgi:hypothetical protein